MWAQKSSSASEPSEVKATTMRHSPPRKHARRQPGTARDVPSQVMGAQRVEDPGHGGGCELEGDLHDRAG